MGLRRPARKGREHEQRSPSELPWVPHASGRYPLAAGSSCHYNHRSVATPEAAPTDDAPVAPQAAIPRKTFVYLGLMFTALWAFAIHTGSMVVEIIVGVLTAVAIGLLLYAFRMVRKQRGLVATLQGATAVSRSPPRGAREARGGQGCERRR